MHALFNGMIMLAASLPVDRALNLIQSAFETDARVTDRTTEAYCLWFTGQNRYYGHMIEQFLREITPFTLYGDIAFCTSGIRYFRWCYSRGLGQWQKQNGVILYERAGDPLIGDAPDTGQDQTHASGTV